MGNPFEYRELMAAHMHVGEARTVEEVIAAQKQRHEESMREAKSARKGVSIGPGTTPVNALPQAEVDKVMEMLSRGQPRPDPPPE